MESALSSCLRFISTTAMDAGIPGRVAKEVVPFRYNDLASLDAAFAAHPGRIAAVILEPEAQDAPEPGFLARKLRSDRLVAVVRRSLQRG